MTKLEQFFYDNASTCYDPATETWQQGQERRAKRLAEAVRYALEQGWRFEWDNDKDEPCNCGERNCGHAVEYCLLHDGGHILGSLSGISGATDDYRRIVEAELALEAMHSHKV